MLIPGGTGGTDPTSLPRDRFCGQVSFQIKFKRQLHYIIKGFAIGFHCTLKVDFGLRGCWLLQALGYCPDAACSASELGPVSQFSS